MAKINAFEFLPLEQWRFTHRAKVQLALQKAKDIATKDFQFENLEYQIDEYLRQWMLRELIETYNYPENRIAVDELLKTSENSKITGLAIKNEKKQITAIVSTGYFGESDLDFENACHKLQNDLDTVSTAFFGMVTDGRRIARLVKSDGISIADYQTVEEFPSFEQLEEFTESGAFPELRPVTQRFQKLPPPKLNVQAKAGQPTPSPSTAKKSGNSSPAPFAVAADANYLIPPSAKPRKSATSFVGFLACLVILVLGGAWYAGAFSRPQSNAPAQPLAANPQVEKPQTDSSKIKAGTNAKAPVTNVPVSGPTTYDEVPSSTASRSDKSSKSKSSRGVNDDGTIKLSNNDIAIMQTRPAANPNGQQAQSKVYTQPQQQTAQSSGTMQKKRQMVQTPF